MNSEEQTTQQIERAVRKIAQKFPADEETSNLTDIHLRVSQESGEMVAFNDDGEEVNRCVIEQWINNRDERFYDNVTQALRRVLSDMHETVDNLGILKPYSFVLEDDDENNIAELYVADDDTIIIGGDLMNDLDEDLDTFMKNLLDD